MGEHPQFEIWVDAQLPPALAVWLHEEYDASASHVEDLGLLNATPVLRLTAVRNESNLRAFASRSAPAIGVSRG